MATMQFEAEPYPLAFEPASTALLIIDMQRDFVEPGGFGEMLGNDVSLLRSTIEPMPAACSRRRGARADRDPHPRRARPDLACPPPSAGARWSRGRDRRQGTHGPHPGARGARHDLIPELYPIPGEPVIDKPGKGSFYLTDLDLILHNRGIRTLIVAA